MHEQTKAGHILQPALTRKYDPSITDSEIVPASFNKALLTEVLRGELGYQGLIITDATPMVGFSAMKPRHEALRLALLAGADMLMFCKNIEEDMIGLEEDVKEGRLPIERVEDAISGVRAGHAGGFLVACVGDASAQAAGDYNLSSIDQLMNLVK